MTQREFEEKYINKILCGNALAVLKSMPDEIFNCCITSPPYWRLRDYGIEGQVGLEKTPEEYIDKLVDIFKEVKKTLKKDRTLWLNLGDSYAGGGRGCDTPKQQSNKGTLNMPNSIIPPGLKQKDLSGIPWRVALALQKDGWYLRQDIIWAKPNPMPESVKDRCVKSHEYVFLISKSSRYYFDYKAIQEDSVDAESYTGRRFRSADRRRTGLAKQHIDKSCYKIYEKRNKRSVWTINVSCNIGGEKKEHFATFPETLVVPMIKAGCPEDGLVLDPFAGACTVCRVAAKLGRNYCGIELNPKYIAEIGEVYIKAIETGVPPKEQRKGQRALFEVLK